MLAILAARGGTEDWYSVETWSTDQGLPHPRVTALAASRDGSIWIGTDAGLARFDGERFETEPLPPGARLRDQKFGAILETADGRVFAGAEGALFVGRAGSLIRHPGSSSLADAAVLGLAEQAGTVWLTTSNRLFRIEADQLAAEGDPPGLAPNWFGLASAPDGGLWLAGKAGLARHAAGHWEVMPNDVDRPAWTAITVSPSAGAWFARQSGAVWDTAGTNASLRRRLKGSGPHPNAIAIGAEGIWVGHDNGLVLRDIGDGRIIAQWALPSVECLFIDHSGLLWVGMESGGLARLRPLVAREWRPAGPPQPARMKWLGAGPDGTWRGGGHADNGGYWLRPSQNVPDGPTSSAIHREPLPAGWNHVSALAPAGNGGWIATFDGRLGFQDFAPGIQPVEIVATNLPRIQALWPGAAGECWVVADRRLGRAVRPAQFEWFPIDQPGTFTRAVTAVSNDVHFATDRGLWKLAADRKSIERVAGLPPARNLVRDSAGRFWLGTFRRELAGWDGRQSVRIGPASGLPDAPIEQLALDASGRLWIAMGPGLYFASADEIWNAAVAERRVEWQRLSPADGAGRVEFTAGYPPNVWRDARAHLWFATLHGVLEVRPGEVPHSPARPGPLIRRVRSGSGELELPAAVEVPYERRALGFEFAAPDRIAPELASYRVRLDNGPWSALGGQRHWVAYETPVGPHRFEVEATDHRGRRHTQSLAVLVGPPWWRTYQFYLVVAAALIASILGVRYALRLRYRLVRAEADRRLLAQREEISRDLHDSIGSELARLGYLSGTGTLSMQVLRASLREIRASLDEIVFAVDPRKDLLESFLGYLAEMAQRLVEESDVRLTIDFPEQVPHVAMSPRFRHALLLATRESIANTLRHSKARALSLRATWKPPQLEIALADDGAGFDLHRVDPNRNGLTNQRRRLESVGGQCRIESAPGEGTRTHFSVAIEEPD